MNLIDLSELYKLTINQLKIEKKMLLRKKVIKYNKLDILMKKNPLVSIVITTKIMVYF